MKKNVFLLIMMVVLSSLSFAAGTASNVKKVSKYSAGSKVSKTNLEFLDFVVNGTAKLSRGTTPAVTVGEKKFKVGDVLTADDAKLINDKISEYTKKNPGQKKPVSTDKSRCYGYWYYECDYYYCYYYWICY